MVTPSRKKIEDLFEKACNLHALSDFPAAEKIYITLLELLPDSSLVYYNIGLLYFETGEFEKALIHYSKARKLAPNDPDTLYNYALCQKNLGYLHEAVSSFKQLTVSNPTDQEGLYNLGNCYRELKEYDLARQAYYQVLEYAPDHLSANKNLAYIYHLSGDTENELIHYNRILKIDPNNSQARHMVAAISGKPATTAPLEYITDIFNNYSETFETDLLVELQYTVPSKLRSFLKTVNYPDRSFSKGLDLGCGTGLAGVAFSDLCEHLSGIDLSSKMIEKAKEKKAYESLEVAEILSFLRTKTDQYDLVIAADVVTYIGDLTPLFAALTPATNHHALLCFSAENCKNPHFQLCPTGRFAHSQKYILTIAAKFGWVIIDMITTHLRREKKSWVDGTLYYLTKSKFHCNYSGRKVQQEPGTF